MEIIKSYGIIIAFVLWFFYKWHKSKKIIGMLPELKNQGAVIIDVRSATEFKLANAPGTINIPLHEIKSRLGEIPTGVPLVLCCATGTRSGMARMVLKKNGHDKVYNIGAWSKLL